MVCFEKRLVVLEKYRKLLLVNFEYVFVSISLVSFTRRICFDFLPPHRADILHFSSVYIEICSTQNQYTAAPNRYPADSLELWLWPVSFRIVIPWSQEFRLQATTNNEPSERGVEKQI